MKLKQLDDNVVSIVLSRKNLLTLLYKLTVPNSFCTIQKLVNVPNENGTTVLLIVKSEEDQAPQGIMTDGGSGK